MKKTFQLGLLFIGALALSLTLASAEGKCGNSQKGMMNNDSRCGDSQKDMKRGDGRCGDSQKDMKRGDGRCGTDGEKRKEAKPAPDKGKCGKGKCGE
ncbi:MAG: hypothetical protein ABF276_08885 [Sulfurovum sp.]